MDASKLIAHILKHDQHLNLNKENDTALMGKKGRKWKFNSEIICFKCKEKEHIQVRCKSKKDDQKSEGNQNIKANQGTNDFSFLMRIWPLAHHTRHG